MSTPASHAGEPVQQALVALRSGQEKFSQFVLDSFGDLERMLQKLRSLESRLHDERNQLEEERRQLVAEKQQEAVPLEVDSALQARVAELEQERLSLEQELESVRNRAVGMAETITEQKRQMADEHAQWSAELRQLRRILDKQATWIAQQAQAGAGPWTHGHHPPLPGAYSHSPAAVEGHPVEQTATQPGTQRQPANYDSTHGQTARQPSQSDPVLGSVLSQFELLQRDVARRREAKTG